MPTKKADASGDGAQRPRRFSRKTQSRRHGRVAWLTAFQPITVAGPRPICTAFPASLACKIKLRVYAARQRESIERPCLFECASPILPVGLALFDESAKALLRILETLEFVEKDAHGFLEPFAEGKSHSSKNGLFGHS